jgi:hypothetical protein
MDENRDVEWPMDEMPGKRLKRDLVVVFLGFLVLVILGAFLRPYYVTRPVRFGGTPPDLSTRVLESGVRYSIGAPLFDNRKYIPFPVIYGIGMLLLIAGGARFLSAAKDICRADQPLQAQAPTPRPPKSALAGLLVALVSLVLVVCAEMRLAPFALSFMAVWPAVILSCRGLVKSTASDYASRRRSVLAVATILSLLPLVSFTFQFAYPSGIYLGWKAFCPWLLLAFTAVLGAVLVDSILESEIRLPDTRAFAMSLAGYGAGTTAWFIFRFGTGQ